MTKTDAKVYAMIDDLHCDLVALLVIGAGLPAFNDPQSNRIRLQGLYEAGDVSGDDIIDAWHEYPAMAEEGTSGN